ncbi:MAG: tetratricopeptide repeat protein [Thermodesulfobacteriota bacterium]
MRGGAIRRAALLALGAGALACSAATSNDRVGVRADARTLEQSSFEAALRGDLERARALEERALVGYRSIDATAAMAGALNRVGNLRQRTGDPEGARVAYLEAQSLSRLTGDRAEEAAALSNLGTLYEEAGDLAAADAHYQQAHAVAEAADADATLATILNNQALLARKQGDPRRAIALLESALAIDRERGNDAGAANRLRNLGAVHAAVGDGRAAVAALGEALEIDRRRENIPEIALDLVTLSEVNARDPASLPLAINQRRRAADIHRLLDRAAQLRDDEAAIATWCDTLRERDPAAVSPVDCAVGAGGAASGSAAAR